MNITLDADNNLVRMDQDERRACWKGRRLSKQGTGFRTIDAAEARFRNKLERERQRLIEQKKRDRLSNLRENY